MLLYKYLRPYNKLNGDDVIVEDLFGQLLIRFTQPKKLFFNDPFDFRPEIRGYENPNYVNHELVKAKASLQKKGVINTDHLPLEEKILYEGRMSDLRKKHTQNITSEADKWENEHLDSLFQKMGKEIGVLCLCEQPDNIRMWSHYAEKHSGFVVGFDAESDFFTKRQAHEPEEIGQLRKVTYLKNRPIVQLPYDDDSPYVDYLFTKYHKWCDEKERRIFRFLSEAAKSKGDICLFSVPPKTIREIIFGSLAAETKEPSIEPTWEIIKSNPDLNHVKRKRARLARNGYGIEIVDFPAP
jgi:hypothetical protein